MAPRRSTVGGTDLGRAAAKLQRARDNGKKFTRKEQAMDEELKQLQERTCWLNTLRKLNKGQYNDWMGSVHKLSIIPYCQSWNLQFAKEMQARLPVEMRNLVYRYLWDKATISTFADLSKVAGGSKCVEDECDCSRPHKFPTLPHFVKTRYTGVLTTREIVRALYDAFHSTGQPVVVRLPEHILSAVSKDMFKVGLDPGEHLRSLVVRLKLDRLRKSRWRYIPEPLRHDSKLYIRETELTEWLKGLVCIKHKAKFTLRIVLYQRNIRIAVVEEVLTALTNIWEVIHNRDGVVRIDWIYRGDWHDGINRVPDDVSDEPLCRKMDDFFVLQRKFWRNELLRFLVQAEMDGKIHEKYVRFYNEPCEHVPDVHFVNTMWESSENEFTTDGEDEDQDPDEPSSEDEDDGDNDDDCANENVPIYRRVDYIKVEDDTDGSEEVLDKPDVND